MKKLLLFLMMLLPVGVMAQTGKYEVLDIKKIASMLIAEKESRQINDAPFIDYLDSLGFKRNRQIGVDNYEYKLGDAPITVRVSSEGNERCFELYAEDHSFCWYHFVRLKEFGLKGPDTIAKGKGLTAVAGRDRLRISYALPQKGNE